MTFQSLKGLITIPLATLITVLSINFINIPVNSNGLSLEDEHCINLEDFENEKNFPDFFEFEEEEELIVHEKRMGLIKVAAEGVLSTFKFGYHIEKVKIPEEDTLSPPPRC